ncbi:MAG: YbaB/EbfC family nucleoid-associated protein [Synergistaceae bacterium]|jgi:DNA-binding YbaB/EbfC family protein|nr:YbaB/EbfC family nucleoid-associated protein [Synergistaceae bacterium]
MKMNDMLKQAQQMQSQMLRVQESLGDERVEGAAGGGMVKTVFDGRGDLLEVKIDPAAIDPNDAEMLEDLVTAAVNDGLRKSRALAESKMGAVTSALGALGSSLGLSV